jgi:hypothetical protein
MNMPNQEKQADRPMCERCKTAPSMIDLPRHEASVWVVHHYCADCARALGIAVLIKPIPG